MLPDPTDRTVHRLTRDGLVRDWLAGPIHSEPIDDLGDFLDADGSPWGPEGRWVLTNGPDVGPLKERLAAAHPLPDAAPPAPIEDEPFAWSGMEGTWRRVHTAEDGFVDWSEFCFTPEYRRSLAATVLEVDQAEWRELEFASTGPFVAWLDGEVIARSGEVSYMEPLTQRVRVRLPSGASTVHVATWQAAFRECRHILRLRVRGLPVRVIVPSPGADEWTAARLEPLLNAVGSPSWAVPARPDALLPLVGPPGLALRVCVHADREDAADWQRVRLDDHGHGHVEPPRSAPGSADTATAVLDATALTVRVRADDDTVPLERVFSAAVLPADTRTCPVGDAAPWRQEVLEYAATGPMQTARAIARIALDSGGTPDPAELATGLHRIETRGDCADFEALALLHLLHRLPANAWEPALAERVVSALTGLRFWIEEPGLDAMCFFTENHQFVWHVAQRLTGAIATGRFADGRTGAEHAIEGGRRAAAWMRRKLDGGFSEFDSNAYLAINALSLVSLIEFDDDPELVAPAEALLDLMLLTLCANSWHGIHGSAHGRSYVHTLRSARFEETSPLLRVIAGVGSLHPAVLPAVALAAATRYRIPAVLAELAAAEPEEWWATQSFRGQYALDRDLLERPFGSDLAIWRTPHGMLSCAQDYRPGLPGLQEHVGGAVLGREVQVFVTNPANSDSSGSARPNAWSGHRILPRVRQHRGTQLGLFPVTPGAGPASGTHLWLPLARVDEWRRTGSWLAARVGDGFVAVAAEGGVTTLTSGATAGQEHRPAAPRDDLHRWVTVLGPGDGGVDFAGWCQTLTEPEWDTGISFTTPEGTTVTLTWDGPFLVDGRSPDLDADGRSARPPRLDNPATHLGWNDDILDARWAGRHLTIDLAAGRRIAADLLTTTERTTH